VIVLTKMRNRALFSIFALITLCLPSNFPRANPALWRFVILMWRRNREFNEGLGSRCAPANQSSAVADSEGLGANHQSLQKAVGEHTAALCTTLCFRSKNEPMAPFYYEAPDKGRIDIEEVKVPVRGQEPKAESSKGSRIRCRATFPRSGSVTANSIAQAIVPQKQYQVHNIPAQGTRASTSWMAPCRSCSDYRPTRLSNATTLNCSLRPIKRWSG
jgi:hypothetical protein